jgi:flagellar biosynthetic protein FliR
MNAADAIAEMVARTNLSLVIFTVGLMMCRIVPVLVLSPFLGGEAVPNEIKIGTGVTLSIVLFPAVRDTMGAIPTSSLPYIGLMLKELFIGMTIAYCVNVVFDAVRSAGTIIDTMSGSNNAQIYAPQLGQQVSLYSDNKIQLTVVLFLTLNGHHLIIEALADSFVLVPLDRFPRFSQGLWPFFDLLIRAFGELMKISLAIAAPAMLAAFLTDLALGMVNRVAPQLQVFFISMAVKPLVAAMVTFMSITLVMGRLQTEFAAMIRMLRHALFLLS